MKIFYAVQATGNGHISRAMEILPFLQRYGDVDIFLSGSNSSLQLDGPVKYRSKGLCIFYNKTGSVSYPKTIRQFSPVRLLKEAHDLPVEKYDLVLNDFESVTALACAFKKIPSVNFGHQASFQSEKTPRPAKKDFMGEWILKNYGRASQYIGLHFTSYDDFILPPVIKKEIILAEPLDKGHITVYLPSYSDTELAKYFSTLKNFRFHVFSKEVNQATQTGNIHFIPVDKNAFNKSMINCTGIICGAGFETPAEALYLGKKLMVIPIRLQYEQLCNAAALEKLGVTSIEKLDHQFAQIFENWINDQNEIRLIPDHSTESIISFLMHSCAGQSQSDLDYLYPELVIN